MLSYFLPLLLNCCFCIYNWEPFHQRLFLFSQTTPVCMCVCVGSAVEILSNKQCQNLKETLSKDSSLPENRGCGYISFCRLCMLVPSVFITIIYLYWLTGCKNPSFTNSISMSGFYDLYACKKIRYSC